MITKVILKTGREKSIRQRHPWIYSGAVAEIKYHKKDGELCDLFTSKGEFLARGYLNTKSQIICRILTFEQEEINKDFFYKRLWDAYSLRKTFITSTTGFRWVHSESDALAGLIVDVYDKGVCCQFLTLGINQWRKEIVDCIKEIAHPEFIYEKAPHKSKEGLRGSSHILWGAMPEEVTFKENGIPFFVDIPHGQKTGFFLDQRENRKIISKFSQNKLICDCFAYTGAFSVYTLKGGAKKVVLLETSSSALKLAYRNLMHNGFSSFELIKGDVVNFLKETPLNFNLIILDPPPFAQSKANITPALKAYENLNQLAISKLAPCGLLATFSCSHYLDNALFKQAIFKASLKAGREVQILKSFSHPLDHPVSIYHPEGEYLKGFLLFIK